MAADITAFPITTIKVSEMTADATPNGADLLYVVDSADGSSKNMTITDLLTLVTGGGSSLTQEQVEDMVAVLVAGGTGVEAVYDDAAGTLNIGLSGEEFTTADKAKLDSLPGDNIYLADGALTGNRVMDMDTNSLTLKEGETIVEDGTLKFKDTLNSTMDGDLVIKRRTADGGLEIRDYAEHGAGSPGAQPYTRVDVVNTPLANSDTLSTGVADAALVTKVTDTAENAYVNGHFINNYNTPELGSEQGIEALLFNNDDSMPMKDYIFYSRHQTGTKNDTRTHWRMDLENDHRDEYDDVRFVRQITQTGHGLSLGQPVIITATGEIYPTNALLTQPNNHGYAGIVSKVVDANIVEFAYAGSTVKIAGFNAGDTIYVNEGWGVLTNVKPSEATAKIIVAGVMVDGDSMRVNDLPLETTAGSGNVVADIIATDTAALQALTGLTPGDTIFNQETGTFFIVGADGTGANSQSTGGVSSSVIGVQSFVSTDNAFRFGTGVIKQACFLDNGNKVSILWGTAVRVYDLSTPFKLSTAVLNSTLSDTQLESYTFSKDGFHVFYYVNADDNLESYDLTTAFDLSTKTNKQIFAGFGYGATTDQAEIAITDDGLTLYSTYQLDSIRKWVMTTANDISTMSSSTTYVEPIGTNTIRNLYLIDDNTIAFNSSSTGVEGVNFVKGIPGTGSTLTDIKVWNNEGYQTGKVLDGKYLRTFGDGANIEALDVN